ncbi:MAG: endonuclease/exonuclease/phosphatase family protein [Pseudomonadales bacterium]
MLREEVAPSSCEQDQRVRHLRLLSFNIQAGIQTTAYRHYFTRGWQHVIARDDHQLNLRSIADLFAEFDVVALQEIDGGSLRSGFVNQVDFLANHARFPYSYAQRNRNLGLLGQHGNGVLSRFVPSQVEDHRLPGAIPGRGAMVMTFGDGPDALAIIGAHLSLSRRARWLQLNYLAELIMQYKHVVLMGDLNASLNQLLKDSPLRRTNLVAPALSHYTYPSWKPAKALDHILVSPHLKTQNARTLGSVNSDHLPLALNIEIPASIMI